MQIGITSLFTTIPDWKRGHHGSIALIGNLWNCITAIGDKNRQDNENDKENHDDLLHDCFGSDGLWPAMGN
jgi:hypothetical protein